ncbi:MAG: hypothetical protein AAF539_00445, partial [Planctomycetota bacterium]
MLSVVTGWASKSLAQPVFESADPATEQLILRAAAGPAGLGRSLSMLTRSGDFSAVDQLLIQAANQPGDAKDQAITASKIGPKERLRLLTSDLISPQAKSYLDQLFKSRRQQSEDPNQITAAINQLKTASPDQRLAAMRILFEGGRSAIAGLLTAVTSNQTETTNKRDSRHCDELLSIALRLDRDATLSGLRRLALYGQPTTRASAIDALNRVVNPTESIEALLTALHAVDVPADNARNETTLATEHLLRKGIGIPTRSDSLQHLRRQLESATDAASKLIREPGRDVIWTMNPERVGVATQTASPLQVAYRHAADVATQLTRVGDDDPTSIVNQQIAQLAYRVINDPDWGDADQVQTFVKNFSVQASELNRLLNASVAITNDPATLGLIRIAGNVGDVTLLRDESGQVTPLVQMIDHPHPTIRFEAARIIANLLDEHLADRDLRSFDYAGQHRVRKRLESMTRLDQQ